MKPGPRGDGLVWTKAMIVYAIDLWARRHGHPPAARDWDLAGEDHPSRQTVQRVFGTWNAAIKSAGFVPRRTGKHRVRGRRHQRDLSGRFLPLPTIRPEDVERAA